MSHSQSLPPLRRIAICGGTHGNEMSGVYLVKHWLQDPSELQRSTFQVTPFVGNPRAVEQCVRYTGRDLNRTFAAAFLNAKASDSDLHEIQRAQEINQIFGPKGSSQAYDFMLDLHNTTANMGSCLLLKSEFSLLSIHVCNYIQKHCTVRHCPILICQQSGEEANFMMSVAKHGLGTLFPAFEIEAYTPVERKDFPRYPNGEISAVIHPNLQDKDFQPLKPGDPVFQTFDGEDILHDGDDTFFPVFINEAAYYEKKTAFWKTKKETFAQPALQKAF
ncbi:N-acyl-aromatic-L-amino acid amidohydrolase (carboxylate-forming) isoform X2 [Erythrolamprus reginae]|uniref:N-acyl-aromatic-L-amino acid amidohydrolase (carboxylate-forming) isoform X2 n=1 Tax=Erythrolamprus reginae TaxID=121349 RepID=UPI00396C8AB9